MITSTNRVLPLNGTMPNSGKTTARIATCQMKIPYDHLPRASITREVRMRNGPSLHTSGASSA
ncbi:hypothetical protein AS181_14255 [Gordonia sp. SGD-V-85]|nr:hypothetical protein AS181_14255 [Gordonia sp. SGD-V-85]